MRQGELRYARAVKESTKTTLGVFVAGLLGMVIGAAIFWGQVAGRVVKPSDVDELKAQLRDLARDTRELRSAVAPITDETGMWWCNGDSCMRAEDRCQRGNRECRRRRLAWCAPNGVDCYPALGLCGSHLSGCAGVE